jgi:hypothetical protein
MEFLNVTESRAPQAAFLVAVDPSRRNDAATEPRRKTLEMFFGDFAVKAYPHIAMAVGTLSDRSVTTRIRAIEPETQPWLRSLLR